MQPLSARTRAASRTDEGVASADTDKEGGVPPPQTGKQPSFYPEVNHHPPVLPPSECAGPTPLDARHGRPDVQQPCLEHVNNNNYV